jgi:hypothetical protein
MSQIRIINNWKKNYSETKKFKHKQTLSVRSSDKTVQQSLAKIDYEHELTWSSFIWVLTNLSIKSLHHKLRTVTSIEHSGL